MSLNPKWLIGKTIARVEMHPFPAGTKDHPRGIAHSPRIWFTDGSSVGFITEETEHGFYGTNIVYSGPIKNGLLRIVNPRGRQTL